MSISKKADYQGFVEHCEYLQQSLSGHCKPWWPKFIFHYTDLENATSILETRCIYSREAALRAGVMKNDNASATVMGRTTDDVKTHARFYFRPRTPTQFRNEGIRAKQDLALESNCPVPVFFLLDAVDVLTRKDTVFCAGSAYYGWPHLSSAVEFSAMPFDLIYHDGRCSDLERAAIVNHRHAEVLVPGQLAVDRSILRFIVCRSPAEKSTLLDSLSADARAYWGDRVSCSPSLQLFFGRWTYVVEATLGRTEASFLFNVNSESKKPFDLRVEFLEVATGTVYSWDEIGSSRIEDDGNLKLDLRNMKCPDHYTCTLLIDGHVAFRGGYVEEPNLPF